MKSLELVIKYGEPAGGARHRFGGRRSGLPNPPCPCCGREMMCLFSLDGSDPLLAGSPLPVAAVDYDVFGCLSGCYMPQVGYSTRVAADGAVSVVYAGTEPDKPILDYVPPYPVSPVELAVLANQAEPTEEERYQDFLCREVPPGFYHRICSYVLWGSAGETETAVCRFCGGATTPVMITDSDERVRLPIQWPDGTRDEGSLLWADLDYLAIQRCADCGGFSYLLMM